MSDLTRTDLHEEVQRLANQLAAVHGDVRIARERSGLQIYIACPHCLERNGTSELQKKHLAIAAERVTGTGKYIHIAGTFNADNSCRCMKEGVNFKLSDLLAYPPLSQRKIVTKRPGRVTLSDTSQLLVTDAKGVKCAYPPGDTVPLHELPADHPARYYLANRGYSIAALESQLDACWCTAELPEDKELGRVYKWGPNGFRDTPQGRICFMVDVAGSRRGWQARRLEHEQDGIKYYFHPYENQWTAVAHRETSEGKLVWMPNPGYEKLDISKYKTAFAMQRGSLLMGLDAAVRWNAAMRPGRPPVCCISEGPLDAGRIGAPALAILGKNFNEDQAMLVSSYFRRAIIVADNDASGAEAKEKLRSKLAMAGVTVQVADVPKPHKDVGEMTTEAALALVLPFLFQ